MVDRGLADRFWAKVARAGANECWLWTGADAGRKQHYGKIATGRYRTDKAHRVSWALHNGLIPPGMFVLHTCDVERCVNPFHLFLGTQSNNMKDMHEKSRHPSKRLSVEDVVLMRKLWTSGAMSSRELAALWGCTFSNVLAITRRLTWRHVPSGED